MSKVRMLCGLAVLSAPLLAGCGSGSSPAQPTATPTPTPTPTPAPTPTPRPLSVIPTCHLPPSSNTNIQDCTRPASQLRSEVYAALDRVTVERPDLFDLNDVNGGPRVLNLDAYMVAVAAALGETGYLCTHIDPEGEIGVKSSNSFSEQWLVASRAGWGAPTSMWLHRKFVGTCAPATF